MKGVKVYTQHTVAWPELPFYGEPNAIDEVSISWSPQDDHGCTFGGLKFLFVKFGPMNEYDTREHFGVQVRCWTDAANVLIQPEIQSILKWIAGLHYETRSTISPERLIEKLQEQGFQASSYHLQNA